PCARRKPSSPPEGDVSFAVSVALASAALTRRDDRRLTIQPVAHPSRRGLTAAPQDEGVMRGAKTLMVRRRGTRAGRAKARPSRTVQYRYAVSGRCCASPGEP